jgi:hypothetical protein
MTVDDSLRRGFGRQSLIESAALERQPLGNDRVAVFGQPASQPADLGLRLQHQTAHSESSRPPAFQQTDDGAGPQPGDDDGVDPVPGAQRVEPVANPDLEPAGKGMTRGETAKVDQAAPIALSGDAVVHPPGRQ